jgi:hypothetical protein
LRASARATQARLQLLAEAAIQATSLQVLADAEADCLAGPKRAHSAIVVCVVRWLFSTPAALFRITPAPRRGLRPIVPRST